MVYRIFKFRIILKYYPLSWTNPSTMLSWSFHFILFHFKSMKFFYFNAYHFLTLTPLTITLLYFPSSPLFLCFCFSLLLFYSFTLFFFSFLFHVTGRAESSLNLKITQYDEDMYARHTTLEILKTSYATEFAECAVLEGLYVIMHMLKGHAYALLVVDSLMKSLFLYHIFNITSKVNCLNSCCRIF